MSSPRQRAGEERFAEEDGRSEEEAAEAAADASALVSPSPRLKGAEELDPEELEERLESASESAERLSLHGEESLSEALLDEGPSLDGFDEDLVEAEIERMAEQSEEGAGPSGPSGPLSPEGGPAANARYRRLLEAELRRLQGLEDGFEEEGLRERSEREDLSSLSAVDQHPADQGTETFDRERDLSIREQVEGELAEVTRALERLGNGTYGRCEACGRPIGDERLAAEPAARLCLADQRQLEVEMARKHQEVEL